MPALPAARSALTASACAGMFLFGIVMAIVGAVAPMLAERLDLDVAGIGTLFLVMNGAMLVTSLLVGLAVDRFGLKLPLVVGSALVAAALVAIASAARVVDLMPAAVCLGLGGAALNGGTNTLIADLYEDPRQKSAALNLLGVFFGVGAVFLPFSLGALLSRLGFAGLLVGTAGLCALTALGIASVRFPAPKQARGWPLAHIPRLFRSPLVVTMAVLLFFQSGNEFMLGGYTAAFMTRDLALGVDTASYVLAAYWGALMLSRVGLSGLLLRISPHALILGAALLSIVGALVIASARTPAAAIAGVVLTGAALAGIFPTVLGVAGSVFPERSGSLFGLLFTAALTGGMTMPWLAGRLAEAISLRGVFVLVAVNFGLIALLSQIARRRSD
ncbi:MAG: MFS transporter [Luteitalea sp.]|nr:MFS transporter [Luteitalea sp.]